MKQLILDSVLAGFAIGLGGLAYLTSLNPALGAALFAVGLFIICTYSLALFTGKACQLPYKPQLGLIWLGNLAGSALVAGLLLLTRHQLVLQAKATALFQIKMHDSFVSLVILGWFCNICIYLAVDGFKRIVSPIGKYLALWLGVMVFVLSGLEHCVANMFYWWLAGAPKEGARVLLAATLGNLIGGASCAIAFKKRSET